METIVGHRLGGYGMPHTPVEMKQWLGALSRILQQRTRPDHQSGVVNEPR